MSNLDPFHQLGRRPPQVPRQPQPQLLRAEDAMGGQAGPIQRGLPFGGGGNIVKAYRDITQQELRDICRRHEVEIGNKRNMYERLCLLYTLDTLKQNCKTRGLTQGRTKQQCIEQLINF
jgi:hypothetical protein